MKYKSEYEFFQNILEKTSKKKFPYIIDISVNEEDFEKLLEEGGNEFLYTSWLKIYLKYDLDYIMSHDSKITPYLQDYIKALFFSLFKINVIISLDLVASR